MTKKEQEAADALLEIIKTTKPEDACSVAHAYNCFMQGVEHRVESEAIERKAKQRKR